MSLLGGPNRRGDTIQLIETWSAQVDDVLHQYLGKILEGVGISLLSMKQRILELEHFWE